MAAQTVLPAQVPWQAYRVRVQKANTHMHPEIYGCLSFATAEAVVVGGLDPHPHACAALRMLGGAAALPPVVPAKPRARWPLSRCLYLLCKADSGLRQPGTTS